MNGNPTSIAVNCTHVQKPCPECPYSRTVKPGALGGSSPLVYIGQAVGPFLLPCHKHCDFDDPQWKQKTTNTPQCAGAAIFRANTGVASMLPASLHKMPENHDAVFSSFAEFLSHHTRTSLKDASEFLEVFPPSELLSRELRKQEVIVFGRT